MEQSIQHHAMLLRQRNMTLCLFSSIVNKLFPYELRQEKQVLFKYTKIELYNAICRPSKTITLG